MKVEARAVVSAALPVAVAAGLLLRGAFPYGEGGMSQIVVGGEPAPEGCLRCHADVVGLGPAHDPKAVGCSPCHRGDPMALDKNAAHQGMTVFAGDLSIASSTCGQAACHPDEARRVQGSLMAGAPGILAVDRFVFGETPSPDGDASDDLRTIDPQEKPRSLAESHVRKLCASCHLGMKKDAVGDRGFFARGGGCVACHLAAPVAVAQGRLHPDIHAHVTEQRCEGCHARSGRISLSFRGKLEVEESDPRKSGALPDGRPITVVEPDVHAKAGMTCLDCHTERGVMGDGVQHRHSYEAVDVQCNDCHAPARTGVPPADKLSVAEVLRRSWARMGRGGLSSTTRLTQSGTPLWRTDGQGAMVLYDSGSRREIPRAKDAAYHRLRGHERLSCQACHSAWAPRCTKCHTEFQPDGTQTDHLSGQPTAGEWTETAGGNGGGAPLLALGPKGTIGPFVEGMVLEIKAPGLDVNGAYWAPLDPHTTSKSRPCGTCHGPDAASAYPAQGKVTRAKARLLDDAERGRVLLVGRCIGCHSGYDDRIYDDFSGSVERLRRGLARACRGGV